MSDQLNPFAPPRSNIATPFQVPDAFLDAPMGTRLLNVILDGVGRWVLTFGLGMLSGLLGGDAQIRTIVIGLLSWVGYYVFFEGLFGRTPGKFLTGTKVVDERGGTPRFGQVLGRTFARFVPFEPFSFFGSTPTGWHDRWSGTRVVRVRT